ncbi:hypothetical protein R50072_30900 [Simiduia litorea]
MDKSRIILRYKVIDYHRKSYNVKKSPMLGFYVFLILVALCSTTMNRFYFVFDTDNEFWENIDD